MQIILAKTAGFCFGVNRAVKLTYELLEQGRPVATLGPLIHNPQVVEDLESKGAITCDRCGRCAGRLRGCHPQPRRWAECVR